MATYPFNGGDVHTAFENVVRNILAEIDGLDSQYVLKASSTELENHFVEKAMVQPLKLHVDQQYIESQRTIQVDVSHDFRRAVFPGEQAHVPGTQLKIAIPYEGQEELWKIRPSTYSLGGYPEIDIYRDRVVITMSFDDDTADRQHVKNEIERSIESLSNAVSNQRRDVERHNKAVPDKIKARLNAKRDKSSAAVGVVTGLGIPLKRRDEAATYAAPVTRRPQVSRPKPSVPIEKYKPEPVLEESEYSHILTVLQSMSLVIERNPMSFSTLNEEGIRDHFLLQLNGHYEGAATGETFNSVGKTDILIRMEDRNVFIAECKFWRGPKGFDEAVDQLLGYLTWRDCKCALLIFNRNRDSTTVIQKMHEAMEGRKEWRKSVSHNADGASRYIFVKDSDPGREIVITTMLFDIPSGEGAK